MVAVVQSYLDVRPDDEDRIEILRDVSWRAFELILSMRGDSSSPRFTYLEGVLEIMSPSQSHEGIKSTIGRLVDVFCLENDIDASAYGAWTLTSAKARRGAEPDECWVFGARPKSKPDLAIEVVWTSGRLDKLAVYKQLGVREVWYYRDGKITAYRLERARYRAVPSSVVLPGIDLGDIERLLHLPMTRAMKAYRALLQKKAKR